MGQYSGLRQAFLHFRVLNEESEIEEDDSDFAEDPASETEPAEVAADDENSDSSVEDASDREVRDILTKEQMLDALASMGFYTDPDAPDEETDEELSVHGEQIEGEKAWDAEIRRKQQRCCKERQYRNQCTPDHR